MAKGMISKDIYYTAAAA